jgi:hypothetical protein
MNSVRGLAKSSLRDHSAAYGFRVAAVCLAALLLFSGQPAFTQSAQAPSKPDLSKFSMAGTDALTAAKPGGLELLKNTQAASTYVKSLSAAGGEVHAKQAGGATTNYIVIQAEFDTQASR